MNSTSMVYGFHAVMATLIARADCVARIECAKHRDDARLKNLLQLANDHNIKINRCDTKQLDQLVGKDLVHQGVVAILHGALHFHEQDLYSMVEQAAMLAEPLLLVVLDHVQDPQNLGAIMRSAEAFGAHAVIVPKRGSAKLTAVARKISCGADVTLPFVEVTNLSRALTKLAKLGVWHVGLWESAQTRLDQIDLSGPITLVMGNEGTGLRHNTKQHCDYLASIALAGKTASLNVSVAAGIALYQVSRARG